MKYSLLSKIIPSNSIMVEEKFENSYPEPLILHKKYMRYLLDKIIPSNSTTVGEIFENSYHESINSASKLHELLIGQNHCF